MVYLTGVLTSFIISLTSAPLVHIVSNHDILSQPIYLMMIGFGLLAVVAFLAVTFLRPSDLKPAKSFEGRGLVYYTCCVFMWGGVADFTIQSCHVKLFECGEDSYLLNGEPYLRTHFGISTQFWNAIVHYSLQLLTIYEIDNQLDCKFTVLYWCGSIITSQFVVLVGGLSGSYSDALQYAVWMNVIFAGLPIWIFFRFLSSPIILPISISASARSLKSKSSKPKVSGNKLNLVDMILSLLLLYAMSFNLIRGLGALGSRFPIVSNYVDNYEPYIKEPARFGSTWALYTAVYIVPFYFATLYNLTKPLSQWTVNLSIFFAAGTLQGSFVYMSYSWYPSSNPKFRIPDNSVPVVLVANILLVVTAHLLMFRNLKMCGFFTKHLPFHPEKSKKKKS